MILERNTMNTNETKVSVTLTSERIEHKEQIVYIVSLKADNGNEAVFYHSTDLEKAFSEYNALLEATEDFEYDTYHVVKKEHFEIMREEYILEFAFKVTSDGELTTSVYCTNEGCYDVIQYTPNTYNEARELFEVKKYELNQMEKLWYNL